MKFKNTKYFRDFYSDLGISEVFEKTTTNKIFQERRKEIITKIESVPKNKAEKLDILKNKILSSNCNLKKLASNMVFASGNTNSKIMIIGEAPGSEEDRTGEPFVGPAGKLLDLMLASIQLNRKTNFYVTNMIFWRPPGNRTPNKEEINLCLPFVKEHIEIIDPKFIILLGNVAIKSLLCTNRSVTEMRKEKISYSTNYKNIKCFAMYHPAFLLRNGNMKKETWIDLCNIFKWVNK